MTIALVIIILSKEKAGGSGFIFLFLSLPSLACKVLASILTIRFNDPMSILVSNVTQLESCSGHLPASDAWDIANVSPLSMMCYSISAEEEV